MKLSHTARISLTLLVLLSFFIFTAVNNSYAVQPSPGSIKVISAAALLQLSAPSLQCVGSGEVTGAHPGWSSAGAIQLTLIDISDNLSGLYWCPAAAPHGKGTISYTVTDSLEGTTCQTKFTYCEVAKGSVKGSFSIMATDKTGSYPLTHTAVQNSGELAACDADSSLCNLNSVARSTTYVGNLAAGLPNCTFVAVANWEKIALGVKTDPAVLNSQFSDAGGGDQGLTNDQVFDYWNRIGIGGVRLNAEIPIGIDPITFKDSVNEAVVPAFIAQLRFTTGQSFAGFVTTAPAFHWVVVVGYTQMGPVVVSWGETLQMTWQQWNVEAVSMWDFVTA